MPTTSPDRRCGRSVGAARPRPSGPLRAALALALALAAASPPPAVVRADRATSAERALACRDCGPLLSAFYVPETRSVLLPAGAPAHVLVHELVHHVQSLHVLVTRENFDDQDEADARAVQEAFKALPPKTYVNPL